MAQSTGIEGRAVLTNNGYEDFLIAISPDVPQENIHTYIILNLNV